MLVSSCVGIRGWFRSRSLFKLRRQFLTITEYDNCGRAGRANTNKDECPN